MKKETQSTLNGEAGHQLKEAEQIQLSLFEREQAKDKPKPKRKSRSKSQAKPAPRSSIDEQKKRFNKCIEELGQANEDEYELIRKSEAKKLGVSLPYLDKKITQLRRRKEQRAKSHRQEPQEQWQNGLVTRFVDGKRIPLWRVNNAILILDNAPKWKGRIHLNEFDNLIYLDGEKWQDQHTTRIKQWFEKEWIRGKVTNDIINEAVEVVAIENSINPIKENLASLVWDGIERIPTFFPVFCDAPDWEEDQHYLTATSEYLFLSSVARIYEPGYKIDMMTIFEGDQAIRKTTLILTLFGLKYHIEITEKVGTKEFYQSLRGVWCAEFGELSAFSKADVNKVKQTLSQIQDTYRSPYARNSKTYLRQCIFVGTTNQEHYLKDDPSGYRRFLPVKCGNGIDIEGVKKVLDQLWAEAVHKYQQYKLSGKQWWEIPQAKAQQDKRTVEDSWEYYIVNYLKGKNEVIIAEIMEIALSIEISKQNRSTETRVGNILKGLGWAKKPGLHRPRIYEAPLKNSIIDPKDYPF